MSNPVEQQDREKHGHGVPIHIDRKKYTVDEKTITGAELRQLPNPPIGSDYDLFLEVPGGQDRLIAADAEVEVNPGMHFFSVQKTINPGA